MQLFQFGNSTLEMQAASEHAVQGVSEFHYVNPRFAEASLTHNAVGLILRLGFYLDTLASI